MALSTDSTVAPLLRLKPNSELREGVPSLLLPGDMSASEHKASRSAERIEARSGYDDEKGTATVYNAHMGVSDIDEAKLIRKIDWQLLPWLSLLYLLSFLDRTSIGNAKVHLPILLL